MIHQNETNIQKGGQTESGSDRLPESNVNRYHYILIPFSFKSLFVCFVALRPKSTAMVMAGRSVHLTTLFPGQA